MAVFSSYFPRLGALRIIALAGVASAVAVGLMACSNRNPQFAALHDQGLIPVSRDNPYVGSNLYLATEMEQSAYLFNFFKENGVPQAIELLGSSENSAELRMLYSGKNQMFQAAPVRHSNPNTTEWVIRGPYNLDKSDYRQVSQLSAQPAAQFELWGRREIVGGVEVIAEQRVILPAFVPTPKPKAKPAAKKQTEQAKAPSGDGPAISGVYSASQPELTLDQLALLESKEHAERSPNGDLIHIVHAATETLAQIANWYAGSGEHAKKIADKNSLPVDAKLEPGVRIFIQSELVINPRAMK